MSTAQDLGLALARIATLEATLAAKDARELELLRDKQRLTARCDELTWQGIADARELARLRRELALANAVIMTTRAA